MKHLMHTSLQPGFGTQPGLIDPSNYAQDPDVADRVRSKIKTKAAQIEAQRAQLEQDWLDYYRIWQCENSGMRTRTYKGLNDQYIPITAELVEGLIDQQKAEIFPFNGNIAIRPRLSDPLAPMMVMPVMELMMYALEQAKVRSNTDVALRNSILYGWTPVKVPWEVKTFTDYAREVMLDPMTQQQSTGFTQRETIQFEGPAFHVCDPFAVYVHPFMERDPAKLTWVHENMIVSWDFLLSMEQEGVFQNLAALLEAKKKPASTSQQQLETRNARLGVSASQITQEEDMFEIVEVWTKFDLYGDGRLVPTKITYAGDVVLEVRQNPYNDQEPPYVFHRDTDVMEHFYGRSRLKIVKPLQYAYNGVWNQGLDSNAYACNNMIIVDQSKYHGRVEDIEVAPLMVFVMNGDASEQAIRFVAPPNTVVQAVTVAAQIAEQIRNGLRMPAVLQGKASGGGQTATETATVASAALTSIGGTAMNIEENLMTAWLKKAYKRFQQFMDPMAQPRMGMPIVPPEVLVPDYQFEFLSGKRAGEYMMAMQESMMQAQAGMEGASSGGDHPNGKPKGQDRSVQSDHEQGGGMQ